LKSKFLPQFRYGSTTALMMYSFRSLILSLNILFQFYRPCWQYENFWLSRGCTAENWKV